MDPEVIREDAAVTYRYVRVGLVALVVFLLVSLVLTWEHSCPQGSISAYFYTRTHAVFIAALCAVGICLIAYKGTRLGEDALLNFAGFLAFVVALAPTGSEGVCEAWLPTVEHPLDAIPNNIFALVVGATVGTGLYLGLQKWRPPQSAPTATTPDLSGVRGIWKVVANVLLTIETGLPKVLFAAVVGGGLLLFWPPAREYAHITAAVAMFLAIILVAVYHACYAKAAERPHRAQFYATVATLMLLAVLLAIGFWCVGFPYVVVGVEIALIALFALFWGVQTWDVWELHDRYPEDSVPALADAVVSKGE